MEPWMTTVMVTLIGAGLFFALLAFALAWWLDDQYGEQVSKGLFGYAVLRMVALGSVVISLLVIVGVTLAARHWRWVTVGVSLFGLGALWGLMGLWVADRHHMGRILLSVRSPQARSGAGMSIFLSLSGGALTLAGAWNQDIIWVLQGIYLLSFAVVEVTQMRCRTRITDCGIYAPGGSVRWEQIQACSWQGGTPEFSTLVIQTQRIFLNRQLVRIPWDHYDAVDEILRGRLGDRVLDIRTGEDPVMHYVPVHPIVDNDENEEGAKSC